MTELKKIKYVGLYPILFICDGFNGKVVVGQELDLPSHVCNELKSNNDWQILSEDTEKRSKKGDK